MTAAPAAHTDRHPAGSPVGGRFAPTHHAESRPELAPAAPGGRRDATAGRFAPSVLDPSKVVHQETIDLTPVDDFGGGTRALAANWDLWDDWAEEAVERGRGRCTMCGQHLTFVHVMHHEDFGTFTVGTDCAESIGIAADLGTKVSRLRADRKARAENLKRATQLERFCADDTEFAEAATGADPDDETFDPLIADIVDSVRRRGTPTPAQRDAVVKAAARGRERRARLAAEAELPKIAVPEGRQAVTGEVLATRIEPNRFAYSGDVVKMLVRDDRGFKLWMTAPAALLGHDGGLKGRRVTFTATLEPSADDQHFGYGKRPTRAELLPTVESAGGGG
ncbi:hypothetical protein [Microlunatus ginsengisoli]|uniref:Uncharacterized protein n=1 Tax=Microlunatus ginsengisoli TaxID=363863 RepID=A0ABP7AL78_9ACTN